MKIHLHIGAHKTATTYLQNGFAHNIELLRENGVGYLDLPSIREEFTYKIRDETVEDIDGGALIDLFFNRPVRSSDHTLIISDENLIGTCWQFLQSGQLYPGFDGKLKKLRSIFVGHEIKIFFAVRSYDTFIASAYCEGIRNLGKYKRFDVFKGAIDWDTVDWSKIVQRIIESTRADNMILWRFEEFGSLANDIISRMTCGVSQLFKEPVGNERARQSFSNAAVKAVDIVDRVLGREEANKVLNKMLKGIPKSNQNAGFDPWSEQEKSTMCALFNDHLKPLSPYFIADASEGRAKAI